MIRLKDKYGSDRLEAAWARAQSTHRGTNDILRNILKNGTDRLPLKREQNLFTIPGHDNGQATLQLMHKMKLGGMASTYEGILFNSARLL